MLEYPAERYKGLEQPLRFRRWVIERRLNRFAYWTVQEYAQSVPGKLARTWWGRFWRSVLMRGEIASPLKAKS